MTRKKVSEFRDSLIQSEGLVCQESRFRSKLLPKRWVVDQLAKGARKLVGTLLMNQKAVLILGDDLRDSRDSRRDYRESTRHCLDNDRRKIIAVARSLADSRKDKDLSLSKQLDKAGLGSGSDEANGSAQPGLFDLILQFRAIRARADNFALELFATLMKPAACPDQIRKTLLLYQTAD